MTVVEFAPNVETVANIVDRVTYWTDKGLTRKESVARVAAEFESFNEVMGTAHFIHNELILKYRLTTGDWDEPMSRDDFIAKYKSL